MPVENEIISQTISDLFPELEVHHFDFSNDPPRPLNFENPNHIFFYCDFDPDKLEFGFKISIHRLPEKHSSQRELYIGKAFSEMHRIRVLVPYTKPDEPLDPYYDIIFENGKSFLADDSNTNFGDGTSGVVKIISEYPLVNAQFDKKGQLVGVV